MTTRTALAAIAAGLISSILLGACKSDPAAPAAPWTIYHPEIGGAAALTVDSTNGLWAANAGGNVARFDGSSWTRYGVVAGEHPVLRTDSRGRVWCGGSNGLAMFTDGQWHAFPSVSDDTITAIATGADGSVYVATDPDNFGGFRAIGQYIESIGTIAWWPTDVPDPIKGSRAMIVNAAGDIWIADRSRIARVQNGIVTRYSTNDGLSGGEIRSLASDAGRVWAIDGSHMVMLDGTQWHEAYIVDGAWLVVAEQNQIWAGGGFGFDSDHDYLRRCRMLPDLQCSWDRIPIPSEIQSIVRVITVDRTGAAWFGTDAGVARYLPSTP